MVTGEALVHAGIVTPLSSESVERGRRIDASYATQSEITGFAHECGATERLKSRPSSGREGAVPESLWCGYRIRNSSGTIDRISGEPSPASKASLFALLAKRLVRPLDATR